MLSDFPTVSSHFLQNQTNKPQRRKEKSKIGTPIFTMWKHREWWVWGPWQLALTNHVSYLFLLCRDYKNRETTRWRHVVIVTWVPLANLRFGYNPLRNRCGTLLLPLCDKVFWTSVFFYVRLPKCPSDSTKGGWFCTRESENVRYPLWNDEITEMDRCIKFLWNSSEERTLWLILIWSHHKYYYYFYFF